MIPYGKQEINGDDIEAVLSVLRSEFLTQGPVVPRFEGAVAAYCSASHAVAVNSATSALHIACLALGLKPGDRVWTSPITFVASANCALYCGATVDFVDIDSKTYNISVRALEEKLKVAQLQNRLPKIVIPVHMCGQSCDMKSIKELAQEFGFRIIEDASHAIGGKYRDAPIGSCRYSDITVFSFHPVKIITTAEGGMALTNDDALAASMELLRSHGITRDPSRLTRSDGPWYYQQIALGFNYRMTELQAALGLSQLSRLDKFVERRHQLAERYDIRLARQVSLLTPWRDPLMYSSLHLYVVRLPKVSPEFRRLAFERLRSAGIGVQVHYIPVHTQPYYEKLGFRLGDFPEAESFYEDALSLPIFPTLTFEQQDIVISEIVELLN